MRNIIDGFITVHCFGRWNDKPEFTFLGIGRVVNYKDNFTEVFNKDGSRTFCLEFELSCRDELENPAFINNFDGVFEDLVSTEGKTKYVRHKTRERNPEIIKAKKIECLGHDSLTSLEVSDAGQVRDYLFVRGMSSSSVWICSATD